MKKKLIVLVLALVAALCAAGLFAACDKKTDDGKMTVTFYDGETVLETQKVEKGGKAVRPEEDPSKEGYIFIDWYGTPTFTHVYDFDRVVNDDVSVFAGFARHENDTRDYYLLGSGTSKLLYASNWGNYYDDNYKMSKSSSTEENIYTFTVDLAAGDEFVFAIPGWGYKHGAGYIVERTLGGKECFAEGDKLSNIKVLESGNYTFTMKTYPAHLNWGSDGEDGPNAIYNVTGSFDTIEVVRNGDMIEGPVELTVDYYIKGSGISNWQDVYSPYLKMGSADGVYTLEIYLKAGETFLFSAVNTATDGTMAPGNAYAKFANLDEASKALFTEETENIKAKAAGTYTFTFDAEAGVLTASLDAEKVPAAEDYYLDGVFGEEADAWKHRYDDPAALTLSSEYKLTETEAGSGVYTLGGVALEAGDEVTLFAYTAGATAEGTWGEEGYALLGSYDFRYLTGAGEAFAAVGGNNNNISVKAAGIYTFTFDSYSKIMTIKAEDAAYDVYINGTTITGWDHGFADEFKFTRTEENGSEYELIVALTKGDDFGLVRFDEGSQEGYGDYFGASVAGEGGVTADFVTTGANFVVPESGTYRIVYNAASGKVTIFEAEA